MMNKKVWIAVGIIVLVVIGAIFFFYHSASAAVGNLNIYDGSAAVLRGTNTIAGVNGTEIDLSDTIQVPVGSRVSIILKDGSEVRLEGGTEVKVSDIAYNGQKLASAIFDLQSGQAWSHVQPLANGGKFEVETPTVVATVRGTNFDVSYLDGVSTIYVGAHTVWVSLRSDSSTVIEVQAGSELVVHDASAMADFDAGPVSENPTDDWSNFNREQDAPLEPDIASGTPSSSIASVPSTTPSSAPAKTPSASPKQPKAQTSSALSAPASNAVILESLSLSVQNASTDQNEVDPLSVMATYSDGSTANVIKQVSWTRSPALDIIDASGDLHASFTGEVSITASLDGVTSNVIVVNVNQAQAEPQQAEPQPVTLSSIAVSCQSNSDETGDYQTVEIAPGAQCSAEGSYSDGSTSDITTQVSWGNSGSAGGTIDSDGYYSPASEGTETITATMTGISGQTSVSIP